MPFRPPHAAVAVGIVIVSLLALCAGAPRADQLGEDAGAEVDHRRRRETPAVSPWVEPAFKRGDGGKFCGRRIVKMLMQLCKCGVASAFDGQYMHYMGKRTDQEEHIVDESLAHLSTSAGEHHQPPPVAQRRRPVDDEHRWRRPTRFFSSVGAGGGNVVQQCCARRCSYDYMMTFCRKCDDDER